MARVDEDEILVPEEDDENIGDDSLKKKRVKRRKTKEERVAERKVIFWTLIIVMAITLGFWLAPKVRSIFRGEPEVIEVNGEDTLRPSGEKSEKKNYVEIVL